MYIDFRLLFKILTSSVVPRVGSSDQISWDLKHLLLFLVQGVQLNLPAYMFHFLYGYIKNTQEKQTALVAFPRLLSELFYQSGLVERPKEIGERQVIHEIRSKFFTAEVLVNMLKIRKSEFLYPQQPLLKKEVGRPFNSNVPQVYKNEPLEVIVEYLCILRNDGHNVTMADVQSKPEDELPKRRKRKQCVAQEEESEPAQKKKNLRKIKVEASEERTKHKLDQLHKEPKMAEVTPLVVQDDSEDFEDDLPLSKRPRKKVVYETASQQGNDPAHVAPYDIPASSGTSAQGHNLNPDISHPLNLILPGSSLILPACPNSPPSSADTTELIHHVDRISEVFETVSEMRQEKLDELVSLTKDYIHLQTHTSDDL
ncbi:hypothetical protein P8452_73407 [Trifolium repens]|nr:hypothetical protein P8452_73407 [Trifolium repens]